MMLLHTVLKKILNLNSQDKLKAILPLRMTVHDGPAHGHLGLFKQKFHAKGKPIIAIFLKTVRR